MTAVPIGQAAAGFFEGFFLDLVRSDRDPFFGMELDITDVA
jgi:hypothetical protein